MRKTFYLLLLCAIVMVGVSYAQAAQTSVLSDSTSGTVTDPSVARIAYLEDKIANLETTVQNGCNDSCVDECCCRPRLCGNPGLIGGYDFLWLSPRFSNGVLYNVVDTVGGNVFTTEHGYPTDYKLAPRFWLGYEGYNGLGMRIRYTQFDNVLANQTVDSVDATRTLNLMDISATGGQLMNIHAGMEMHVLDIEFTKEFDVACGGQVTLGTGLRYGKVLYDYNGQVTDAAGTTVASTESGERTIEGIGPTVFIDFQAPIRQSKLSIVGGLRGSVLFGRHREWNTYVLDTQAPVVRSTLQTTNGTLGIIDASLGLQYDRCMSRGVEGFIRLAWEGQLWMDAGSPMSPNGDMAMQGLCLGFGINR